MTPGKHACLCVAIVLFVTLLAGGATPESKNVKEEKNVKTQDFSSRRTGSEAGNSKGSSVSKTPRTIDCVAEDTECSKDKFGYDAIAMLHRLIDDDHNGNVDQSESDEFLRDELQYTDGFERHSLFHNNDKLISVDDLWRVWKYSQVYNWTVEEVGDWLQHEVDLPQYINIFKDNSVNGPFLPRLASSNTFMSTVLGIKNPVHKQKLALKAMDTVLFGAPPKRHSYIKDVVLVASLIFAIGGCWFAYLHHRYSQEQVRKMMIDLESLQRAEEALMDVQRKLEDAESRQVSSVPRPPPDFKEGTAIPQADPPMHHASGEGTNLQIKQELAATLLALQQAETQLENSSSWAAPGELQAWLQLTHELEQVHYAAKRQAAERQFQAAKEVCDKIKRRNKAFFGSMRMAHSNSLDEIDQRILDARVALEEVKQDLQERLQRWHNIERLCGFPIITNPGLTTLYQLLHGVREGGGNNRPPAPLSVDEGDEDMPPIGYPPGPHLPGSVSKSFLRQRATMGSTGSLSQFSRSGVSGVTMAAAYSSGGSHPSHHGMMSSSASASARGSIDITETPSPTSAGTPVSFHLGEQHQHHQYGYTLPHHHHLQHHHQQQQQQQQPHGMNGNNHGRSKSISPSVVSSVNSGYHGNASATPQPAYAHSRSAPAESNGGGGGGSDDNLSQVTMDSLPRSVSSGGMRDRSRILNNNNGLDLVNHIGGQGSPGEGGSVGGSQMLPACLLVKKPSKRKKLLNMFRKSTKQKPV